MKKINKFICWLIIFMIFIIFYKPINTIYSDYIIKPLLNKATQSYFVDFIITAFGFFCITLAFNFYKRKFYVTSYTTVLCLLFLSIYSFYRFTSPEKFLSFVMCSNVKYFDILFCALIPLILLGVISFRRAMKVKKIKSEKIESLIDEAIENPEKDLFNRGNSISRFKDSILENRGNKQAVAFGIVGRWGSGKSSFANLLKHSIKKEDDYIIIDFNPWLSSSPSFMIRDFFITVEKSIEQYSLGIGRIIRRYRKSIFSSLSEKTQTGQFFADILFQKSMSLYDEYEQLNELLQKLNKKVLIFIDDLDRLKSDEVVEILKLIRNTASFSSFIYVVCYDRKYVEDALRKQNIPNSESYTDKIF